MKHYIDTVNLNEVNDKARKILETSDSDGARDLFEGCETIEEVNQTADDIFSSIFPWYAVLRDNDDNDWGTGSYNLDEAKEMAKSYGEKAYIAVIRNDICEEEIYQEDF